MLVDITALQVEQEYRDKVNFVMLNIENPKWAPEMAEYRVSGIPHFVFLNSKGQAQAAAVGRLPAQVDTGLLILSISNLLHRQSRIMGHGQPISKILVNCHWQSRIMGHGHSISKILVNCQ